MLSGTSSSPLSFKFPQAIQVFVLAKGSMLLPIFEESSNICAKPGAVDSKHPLSPQKNPTAGCGGTPLTPDIHNDVQTKWRISEGKMGYDGGWT